MVPPSDPNPPSLRLPAGFIEVLWRRVGVCLARGDVLVTTEHFQRVMEREFRRQLQIPPPPAVREQIRAMVETVNQEHPDKYLSLGIRNALTRHFRDITSAEDGDPEALLAESRRRIREMVEAGRTAFFLEGLGVRVDSEKVPPSLERAILRLASGERLQAAPAASRKMKRRAWGSARVPVRVGAGEDGTGDAETAVAAPDERERQERVRLIEQAEEALARAEMAAAPGRLDALVARQVLAPEEARTLEQMREIEARVATEGLDAAAAGRLREQIGSAIRARIEERLRQAIDPTVRYLSALEGLQRLPADRDDALRLLVRERDLVLAGAAASGPAADYACRRVVEDLQADAGLLASLCRLLERRENEARMIAANLPPYRHVLADAAVDSTPLSEAFIETLRGLRRDEAAEQLNASDPQLRAALAGAIRGLVEVIYRALEPGRFQQVVRALKVRTTVLDLYRRAADARAGRRLAEHYLARRLPRLYPNLDEREQAALQRECEQIMAEAEAEPDAAHDDALRVYRA